MRETGLMAKRYTTLLIIAMGCTGLIMLTRTQPPTPDAFPANTTRYALVSLLSVDGPQAWWGQQKYISAAVKLAHSFREHSESQADMVLLVVDEYGALKKRDEQRLRDSGWMVHRMRSGIVPSAVGGSLSKYYSAKLFSKLWAWRLEMYERILYTDLDTLFVQSPDSLFGEDFHTLELQNNYPAMALDQATRGHHYYNTGVMLLKPSEDEYQRLVATMNANSEHMHSSSSTEQDFLNIFYHGRVVQLDARFNRQVCAAEGCLNDKRVLKKKKGFFFLGEEAAILHFGGENNKPWNTHNCVEQGIVQLCLFWKHYNNNNN
jgi:alpha-N-acetylglucosamine transferase